MTRCPGCLLDLTDQQAVECPDCELRLTPSDDLTFVAELRRLTDAWALPPKDLMFCAPAAGDPLVVWLDICDPDRNSVLLTVGVHVAGGRLVGDSLHNQLMTLPDEPTRFRVESSGTPVELARVAAEWLADVVSTPFELWAYGTGERVVLADTGQAVSRSRDCPPEHTPPARVTPIVVDY